MAQSFDAYYESKEKDLLMDICDSIGIASIAGEPDAEGNPFGKPVTECLEHVLDCGRRFGFQTKDVDHYVGEITVGEGAHLIGILCHADVVDAGSGWKTDPFCAVVKDGRLYGRGAIDDKGPMMCCLYAMHYIKQNDLLPENTRIRMIVGTDEEENWVSIDKYLEKNPEIPEISIVPDASFPVIFCEKGLVNLTMTVPIHSGSDKTGRGLVLKIADLCGGERPNVVAASACCRITCADPAYHAEALSEELLQLSENLGAPVRLRQEESGALVIEVKGRAAHAMTPEKGCNAISYLMKLLHLLTCEGRYTFIQQSMIDFYHRWIGTEYHGESMNLSWHDDDSGDLTVNVGKLEMKGAHFSMVMNIRYPVTRSFDEVRNVISALCEENAASVHFGVCMDPISFDRNSGIVKTLMDVYRSHTGDTESEPIALGGATYARAIPGAIAFGPVFPNQEELAHEANEYYSVAGYRRITEMYVEALLRLSAMIGD